MKRIIQNKQYQFVAAVIAAVILMLILSFKKESHTDYFYKITVVDGCEYITGGLVGSNWHVITHKGNCKYCRIRLGQP